MALVISNSEELVLMIAEGKFIPKASVQTYLDCCERLWDQKCYDISTAIGIGMCYLLKKLFLESSAILSEALSLSPVDPLLLLSIGLNKLKSSSFLDAIDAFSTLLHSPDVSKYHKTASFLLLDCYVEMRDYLKAIDYAVSISRTSSYSQDVIFCYIAHCYEKRDLISDAIEYYKKVIELNSPLSAVCAAYCALLEKNLPEALGKLLLLTASYDSFTQPWLDSKYLLAQYYISAGDLQYSAYILSSLLVENSNISLYLSALGVVSHRLGNIYESFWFFLKSSKSNPSRPETWFNIAVLYKIVKQKDQETAIKRAREIDVNNTLPKDLDETTALLGLSMNLARFGNRCERNIGGVEALSEISRKEINNISISTDIAVPQPIRNRSFYHGFTIIDFSFGREIQKCVDPSLMEKNSLEFKKREGIIFSQTQAAKTLTTLKKIPRKRKRKDKTNSR